MTPTRMPVRVAEVIVDDRNGCRRTKLRNEERTTDGDGFSPGTDGDASGLPWIGRGALAVVCTSDISRIKPRLGRTADCPVYWSGVEHKDVCSLVGSRTGETGRGGWR